MNKTIKKDWVIGARGSDLSVTQAQSVIARLKTAFPEKIFRFEPVSTVGDRDRSTSLASMGGQGVFVKEIENALLEKRIDIAVHSAKDLPANLSNGLILCAVPERENFEDVLISRGNVLLKDLPAGSRVATSSPRRRAMLLNIRPDLAIVDVRGNVETRLKKLDNGDFDAIILGYAGLIRLGFQGRITEVLPSDVFVPAAGQGALAVEVRKDDKTAEKMIKEINNELLFSCVEAERAVLRFLNAGCTTPIGVNVHPVKDGIIFLVRILEKDGKKDIYIEQKIPDVKQLKNRTEKVNRELKIKNAKGLIGETVKTGKVYLVGAGPGDPGLITVRGLELLQNCDAVAYDNLVNLEFITGLSQTVEKFYVGKSAGKHALPQEEINQLLVNLAKRGLRVVRLKGGDPFVFGRGSEEALVLKKNGIEYEVVPGVTAGTAAPAYAGISLTHRNIASYTILATAHESAKQDERPVPWEWFGGAKDSSIVAYMGVRQLKTRVKQLMDGGMNPAVKAALIERGTHGKQRVVVSTLKEIPGAAEKAGIQPPSIFLVGDVAELSRELNWFVSKPLYNVRVLVTRATAQAGEFCRFLRELGAETLALPAIKTNPAGCEVAWNKFMKKAAESGWLVFTSENGVKYFLRKLYNSGKDVRFLGNYSIAAVGSGTAKALDREMLKADFIPSKALTRTLAEELREYIKDKNVNIIRVRGNLADDSVEKILSEAGAEVIPLELYETAAPEWDNHWMEILENNLPDVITFTSGSTVEGFFKILGKEKALEIGKKSKIVSIGPVTSNIINNMGLEVDAEARIHTVPGMIDILTEYYKNNQKED